MKKVSIIITLLIAILFAIPVHSSATENVPFDLNGDNVVNTIDFALMKNAIINIEEPCTYTISDLVKLRRFILNIEYDDETYDKIGKALSAMNCKEFSPSQDVTDSILSCINNVCGEPIVIENSNTVIVRFESETDIFELDFKDAVTVGIPNESEEIYSFSYNFEDYAIYATSDSYGVCKLAIA